MCDEKEMADAIAEVSFNENYRDKFQERKRNMTRRRTDRIQRRE